jgi:hypothetical protein
MSLTEQLLSIVCSWNAFEDAVVNGDEEHYAISRQHLYTSETGTGTSGTVPRHARTVCRPSPGSRHPSTP